jgi:outer membrane protein assembly factor BamB
VPLAAVVIYWIAYVALGSVDNGIHRFFGRLAAAAAVTLIVVLWWLIRGPLRLRERVLIVAWMIGLGVLAIVFRDRSFAFEMTPLLLMYALPALVTGWTLWLLVSRDVSTRAIRVGMYLLPVLAWGGALCLRAEGLTGSFNPDLHARWTPTGEQLFLAERSHREPHPAGGALANVEPLQAGPGDWPEFRGPNRDGVLSGVKIATDWKDSPPKEVWRRRVGPGWSSIIAVGGRLFTQEQRDKKEAVVCLDAATGDEIWSHEDDARFSESMGGDGPRATPTFADGKIYALGATGILNCLDAATGDLKWSYDVSEGRKPQPSKDGEQQKKKEPEAEKAKDAPAEKAQPGNLPPMYWGYSGSPLVVDGLVIVFAGYDREDSLRAFKADSGEPAWKASSGTHSYSSPELATFDGQRHVLFLNDAELTAVDPANGRNLWRYESGLKAGEAFPVIQPKLVGASSVLVNFKPESSALVEVSRKDGEWKIEPKWDSREFKPYFSDCVQYQDALYGFEAPLFCCVDVNTGKRLWKKGRYGSGQALLLGDQGVILVLSESGEAVLVAADPKGHKELGRFQAINGKTWNHPMITGGRLFVRNAEEMACYQLTQV